MSIRRTPIRHQHARCTGDVCRRILSINRAQGVPGFRKLRISRYFHMSTELILQQSASCTTLTAEREQLSRMRAEVVLRTQEVARLRSDLKLFEDWYFREVGTLYADVDALNAQLAERELDLYNSDSARTRAEAARQQADESREAVQGVDHNVDDFQPAASLKTLFRDLARRIHPDLAKSSEEEAYLTMLMARANAAYRRYDASVLQDMLDECFEEAELSKHHLDHELLLVRKQTERMRRELTRLNLEADTLRASETGHLHAEAEQKAQQGMDLMAELVHALRQRVAETQARLLHVDRQVTAHGR